ncbi:MAG TPA: PAS domain S-box protein [Lacibacter sp.]|nr:PAS domain S-box protein [Lacibacter sp.]
MRNKQSIIYILLIYIVASLLWFYVADTFVFTKFKSKPDVVYFLKEAEDFIHIILSSFLLYYLIRWQQKQWALQEQKNKSKENEINLLHLERFNSVTAVTNDILWDWDIQNNKVWRNDNFGKLLGYAPGETDLPDLSNWIDFLHEDDRQNMKELLQKALGGNDTFLEGEYRIITKDKRILTIRDRSHIYRDQNGKAIRIVGSMQDITSLRTSQRLLQKSEEHYRQIVETAHEGIWQVDDHGNTTFVNEAAAHMLGYSKEEMLGKMILDFLFPEDVQAAKDRMKLHMYGVKQLFEFRLRKKSGEELWALVKGTLLYDGKVYKGSIGMFTDITDLRNFTKKLQESEENYRMLFSQNPMPMWVYDRNSFEFLAVNDRALEHYGYTRDEFLKMKVTEIRPPEELNRFLEFNKNQSRELRNSGVWKHVCKNGKIINVEVRVQSLTYKNQEAKLVLINDITDKLNAENELKHSYAQIKQLASHLQEVRELERKRVAREIHDELGQHLTAIKMNMSWLDKRVVPTDESIKSKMKQTINIINESNLAIRKILNELRTDFVSRTSISETLENQCVQLHQQTGITVHQNIEKLNFDIEVSVSNCLYRTLQEAFTNIVRYADADAVWVELKTDNGYIILTIKDDGNGFDPTNIHSQSFGLLGIKERANDLLGNFNLQSTPGNGTLLNLKIPLNKPSITDNSEVNETYYSSR